MKGGSAMKTRLETRGEESREREKPSALDVLRRTGPASKRLQGIAGMPADSMMAVYKNRLTYTFIVDQEVASIHFDRNRGEIFYRGHNVANMKLTETHIRLLKGFIAILDGDERARPFVTSYAATLGRVLADNQ